MSLAFARAAQRSPLSPAAMEQWCATRNVTPAQASRIWDAAGQSVELADGIWATEEWWLDDSDVAARSTRTR